MQTALQPPDGIAVATDVDGNPREIGIAFPTGIRHEIRITPMHPDTQDSAFPIDTWRRDMEEAAEHVCTAGKTLLEEHRRVTEKAAARAEQWTLEERLESERRALGRLIQHLGEVLAAIDACLVLMHGHAGDVALHPRFTHCADTIDRNLPQIEQELVTIRHTALDLLLWSRRAGHVEGSELPGKYRATYAELIRYAPVFRPRLAAMQEDLLALSRKSSVDPEVQHLISALSRYAAVADSARAFIKSVVEPPMQLVFHDTQDFLDGLGRLPMAQRAAAATELNDCCQQLLYDPAAFHRRVAHVRPQIADGIDASLEVLAVDDKTRVIFTVDEDPVFERIEVTLLRVVAEDEVESAQKELAQHLYADLMDDPPPSPED